MKRALLILAVLLAGMPMAGVALAASAEQEAAFIASYRTAFEAKDPVALRALLFTEGAIPMAVEFYIAAMSADFGAKVASIELQELDAEDVARVDSEVPTPDGGKARLAPRPYKKMAIKLDTSDASGTSASTSTVFVAEKDGKLGIALPTPVP